jgi:hypothetical protein
MKQSIKAERTKAISVSAWVLQLSSVKKAMHLLKCGAITDTRDECLNKLEYMDTWVNSVIREAQQCRWVVQCAYQQSTGVGQEFQSDPRRASPKRTRSD